MTAAASDEQVVNDLIDRLIEEFPPDQTVEATFLGAQFDRGLAWVHYPAGRGGIGADPNLQRTISERLAAAGAPHSSTRNPIGHGMAAPTLMAWGSEDQKDRYLRPTFTGEGIWCQLFSEPGAGSDVAGLSSRAIPDGDEWVINGQKVWTTLAHVSRWGLLVVRTDPSVVKHAGLTSFVVDMKSPGIEIRPLRQMTGEAEFNEVYFTDVRIPASEMLGRPGDGWRVSLTTLMNERVSIGGHIAPRGTGPIAHLVDAWQALPAWRKNAVALDEVMKLWSRAEALRLTNIRTNNTRQVGDPGPEGSIGKLMMAELNKDVYAMAMDVLGVDAMLYDSYEMIANVLVMEFETVQKSFLRSRANTIEGGTTEIMKNILGERVLGLPGDVRIDRDRPWSEVPRN